MSDDQDPSAIGSSIERVAAVIGGLLQPLIGPLGSTSATGAPIKAYVAALGWSLPDPVPPSLIALGNDIASVAKDTGTLTNLLAAAEMGGTLDETSVVAALAALVTDIGLLAEHLAQLPAHLQAELPAAFLTATQFDQQFATRLLDALIVKATMSNAAVVGRVLRLIGLFEISPQAADTTKFQPDFTLQRVHWERVSQWFQKPEQVFGDIYGWGTPTLKLAPLFDALQSLSYALHAGGRFDYPSKELMQSVAPGVDLTGRRFDRIFEMPIIDVTAATVSVALTPVPTANPTDVQPVALTLTANGSLSGLTFPITDHVSLVLDGSLDATAGLALVLTPGKSPSVVADIEATGNPLTNGDLTGKVQYERADSEPPFTLLSIDDGSGLTIRGAYIGGGVSASTGKPFEALVLAGLEKGKLTISTSQSDGFLSTILPADGINVNFDFSITWSSATGVHFDGGATLETSLAVNLSIGPFSIDTIHILLGLDGGDLQLALTVTGSGELGPISASVDRIGVASDLAFHNGNLGPVDLSFKFKPPDGLGIAIDAGPIGGGGYILFDPDNGRYAGVLALSLETIAITAIGLLDTKLPGGESGFSFLIIIAVTFDVGIQLGFGFTLTGVGGLCGINRSMITDAIQSGLRKHALDAILFPPDPIKNAPQIISTLSTIYPPAQGRYVFGPMLEIGWGTPTLVTAEIGFLIEVPTPIVIAILGQLAMELPDPDAPVVEFHIDVLGIIDFGKQLFSIDATIHDSRIVLFTVTGDMALRLTWGDNPSFLFSMGGFNPAYQAPANFPTLQRLTISLQEDVVQLTLQAYLAVTSNTFQVGAHLEALIGADAFNVYGWLGFDALIIFSPFSFLVDFTAGLALRSGTSTIMGISLSGKLSGPTPWHAEGDASVSILFFSISVHVSVTIGDPQSNPLPATNVWTPLLAAITASGNWSGALPPGAPQIATLVPPEGKAAPVLIDPAGALTFRQKVVPLDQAITKFGEATPDQQSEFDLTDVALGTVSTPYTTVTDEFARGQFEQLSDADKLSIPSFEPMIAGFSVNGESATFGKQYDIDIEFETKIIDSVTVTRKGVRYSLTRDRVLAMSRSGAAARGSLFTTGLHASDPAAGTPPLVSLGVEQYVVAGVDDLAVRSDIAPPSTKGAAFAALAKHLAANPTDQGTLQVVPVYELAAA